MRDAGPLPTLLLIPTGIGCDVGGYAGDALPSARLLAAASGCLITHPNVMNGAALYWSDPRIHYVEGSSLDRFAAGELLLRPVRRQRLGLLLDAGIEPELRQRHLQVADGCRATLGLDIGPVDGIGSLYFSHFHADYNQGALNTVYSGGNRESYLLLPIIPSK